MSAKIALIQNRIKNWKDPEALPSLINQTSGDLQPILMRARELQSTGNTSTYYQGASPRELQSSFAGVVMQYQSACNQRGVACVLPIGMLAAAAQKCLEDSTAR